MWKLIVFLLIVLALIYYAMLLFQVAGVIQFTDKKFKPGRMFVPFYYWFGDRQEKLSKEKSKLVKPFKDNTTTKTQKNNDTV